VLVTNGKNVNVDSVYFGVALMCAAMLVIPFLNAIAKTLHNELPVLQIVWSRYVGHLLFMIIVFAPTRGFDLFRSRRPVIQLVRSMLLLVSTICYFTALKHIALPTAVAISYTSPIIAVALAAPILGETVGLKRWFIVIFGFLGVLVMLKPGPAGVHWTGLLVVCSSACYAVYQILTRKVAGLDSAETTITYTAVVGAIGMTIVVIFVPDSVVAPLTNYYWLLFAVIGVVAGIGHYLIVLAHDYAPVSILSPLNYVQLLGATILSATLFGDMPSLSTWIGAAMIVVATSILMFED